MGISAKLARTRSVVDGVALLTIQTETVQRKREMVIWVWASALAIPTITFFSFSFLFQVLVHSPGLISDSKKREKPFQVLTKKKKKRKADGVSRETWKQPTTLAAAAAHRMKQ